MNIIKAQVSGSFHTGLSPGVKCENIRGLPDRSLTSLISCQLALSTVGMRQMVYKIWSSFPACTNSNRKANKV